jgi:hypothetical protein
VKKKTITFPNAYLASRKMATLERQKIDGFIREGDIKLHFDLTNVESISESYSDEIFGVLVLKYGAEKVLNSIQLDNTKDYILASVAKVINRREIERNATIENNID